MEPTATRAQIGFGSSLVAFTIPSIPCGHRMDASHSSVPSRRSLTMGARGYASLAREVNPPRPRRWLPDFALPLTKRRPSSSPARNTPEYNRRWPRLRSMPLGSCFDRQLKAT